MTQKKKLMIVVAFLIAATGIITYFFMVDDLRFSSQPGFYSEDLDLSIDGGAFGTVYYTLDGSEPTPENGEKYTGPIHLTDATELPNRASAREDTSAGFDLDFLTQYSEDVPGYTVPNYNVDKGYYIRAVYYNMFGAVKSELSGMYFVNLDDRGYYDDVAVVSITTDEDNLWGYENGIYCTGKMYDDFKASVEDGSISEVQPDWDFWSANYRIDGKEAERPANVQVYDEAHTLIMDTDCGIRLQGNGSKRENQKAFAIFAREEYAQSEKFSVDLTNSGYLQHRYNITSGGGDQFYKLDDYLLGNDTSDGLAFSTSDYRACMLFLNGEFWGMYYICEPYNVEYVSAHYAVDPDNVVIYKNGMINVGDESDESLFDEAYNFIVDNDMSQNENFAKACDYIDMYSFVDYYAMMQYISRKGDWPYGNEACWRTREITDEAGTGYSDGRWRWMVFDLNSNQAAMEVDDVDTYDRSIDEGMWLSLMQNDNFKAIYADRLQTIAYDIYTPDKIMAKINQYLVQYQDCLEASNKRFYGDTHSKDIEDNAVNKIYYFQRRADVCKHIVNYFFGPKYLREM